MTGRVLRRALAWSTAAAPGLGVWQDDVASGGRTYLQHRIVVADDRPGAVIIAVSGTDLVLVKQWRPVTGSDHWELPRGFGQPGETPSEVALRELSEETGWPVSRASVLGHVWENTGLTASRPAVVLVEVDGSAVPGPSDGEVDEVRWCPSEDLDALVRDGSLSDAHSLSAIALWRAQR